MKKLPLLIGIAALSTAMGAQATSYLITSTSTLNDVRKIGGANIPELSQYSSCIAPSTCSGSLDPLDPASWPLMDADLTTYPYADPNDPNRAVGIELNNINVNGTITVVAGTVTAAIINQLNPLSYTTFQSATVQNNMVSGDPSIINCDNISQAPVNAKCVPSVPMTWTYNSGTGQLNHQAGGGTALTSASIATCVPVIAPGVGAGISGQCRQLQAAIDASGELGQINILQSIWNWTGMGANYIVRDGQTLPWHAATGTGTTGGIQISGASGHAPVVWDLSGFVDGVGGTITARVVADVFANGTANATGVSALYTLNLTPIPVPGAVWMLGGALAVLGGLRRRASTVA
ncbi:MAG: VPLPA-CTERM sorting domain-containing protein [Gammaproteobacteria bacterium]|nr:VPLPA-CTERM sorting domain-containing protein [Gammaproteobacteria bacterium]